MRYGVVGAGILGAAIARELTRAVPGAQVIVLEKEPGPARHQTGRGSGVAHAGVYYAPGSLKARLCRRGITELKAYCAEHRLPYEECGKLIVARDRSELERLDEIEARARTNGVPGLRRLDAGALREIEPHVRGAGALHSPSTGIVDFPAVTGAMLAEVSRAGGQLRCGVEVCGFERRRGETRVRTAGGETLAFGTVVVCAGLQSDRLARAAGAAREPEIVPFRGEYRRIANARTGLVRGLVYPVPDPAFPFLGIHFTRRIDGSVLVGPNAVLALAREGYRRRDIAWRELAGSLRAPGLRRFARRHWRAAAREMRGSLSRRAFLAEARSLIPELEAGDLRPAPAGIRAQAIDPDGSLVDDFRIDRRDGLVIVRNAPSPAATSSLAIAAHVIQDFIAS